MRQKQKSNLAHYPKNARNAFEAFRAARFRFAPPSGAILVNAPAP
jgi:hypothetical protein